ncbi:MAG: hypothetical protein NW203_06190 [Hyphomonadaceae bacterium]|nr:hypothetical protein [Hyphomonadaceae bacterium]
MRYTPPPWRSQCASANPSRMTRWSWRHIQIGLKGLGDASGPGAKLAYLRYAAAQGLYLLIRPELESAHGGGRAGAVDRAYLDALTTANDLEAMARRALPVTVTPDRPASFNLLTPLLNPGAFFGGYRAYLGFAAALMRSGARVRFIATDQMEGSRADIVAACTRVAPDMAHTLTHAEIVDRVGPTPAPLEVSRHDVFVAFSCAGAALAHNTTQSFAPGRPFVFFAQDEEGHFHAHDSRRAWKLSTYGLPHIAIYNSPWLEDYFRSEKLGPFATGALGRRALHFRHALDHAPPPPADALDTRTSRKLFFFARPEKHTARNLFELGLNGLRLAAQRGLFEPSVWTLHAVGTNAYPAIALPGGRRLEFTGRLPLEAYRAALPNYDVGLAPMFSPHPSVPNFELAAAGVPTVTTTFANRPAPALTAAAPNLIPVAASVEAIADGLAAAHDRALDGARRVRDAAFDWPRAWSQAFDDDWIRRFCEILSAELSETTAWALAPQGRLAPPTAQTPG